MTEFNGLLFLVVRSLRRHALSTAVTAAAVALGAGLIMAVFSVSSQAQQAFTEDALGFDAVLGARGSKLQLALNAIFHLETSPGNIPWSMYTTMRDDPRVSLAVPYAVGDNYYGFRIVGTTKEIFTEFSYQQGRPLGQGVRGRLFDTERREAVIGNAVARETGLELGAVINPYHGLVFDPGKRHAEEYIVVGILPPTNTPSDRVIWIPIEGVFRMEGHVLRGSGEEFAPQPGREIPDEHKEVSAVLLNFANPAAGFAFDQTVNRQGKVATLAWPLSAVMADFFLKMGWALRLVEIMAFMVAFVAGAAVFAGVYNTMNERRGELAILRSLGARRGTLFQMIVLETSVLALLGSIAGYAVHIVAVGMASERLAAQTGIVLTPFAWHPALLATPVAMVLLGATAGLLPAVKAYRTDIATAMGTLR